MNKLEDHSGVVKVYAHITNGEISSNETQEIQGSGSSEKVKEVNYIVMEFCQMGDFFSLIYSTGNLQPELSRFYFL